MSSLACVLEWLEASKGNMGRTFLLLFCFPYSLQFCSEVHGKIRLSVVKSMENLPKRKKILENPRKNPRKNKQQTSRPVRSKELPSGRVSRRTLRIALGEILELPGPPLGSVRRGWGNRRCQTAKKGLSCGFSLAY